jgi:hypothetical protein
LGVAALTTPQAICFELLRLLLPSLRFASCFERFEGPIGPEARSKIAKQAGIEAWMMQATGDRVGLYSNALRRTARN